MKSFTPFVLVASATLASAQYSMGPGGTFTCAIPNAAYCAGDSLTTNIIIRCDGTVGSPGNCNDNLDGEPPFGLEGSLCWQPSATSGEAACEKNCVVYGGSGNYNGTFTLPDCTPFTTVTTSTSVVSTTTVSSTSSSASGPVISISYTTVTVPCSSGSSPASSPSYPTSSLSTGPASSSVSQPSSNSTVITAPTTLTGSATATPVGPTSSKPASFTGAAVVNQAGAVLAAGGMLMAYLL